MKKKILIVEDNIALSQRLRDRLERCGYAVETAIDEPSARRLIRKSGFDLVLADVRLPKGDGLSLLEWLNGGHRHVPFVVMTGYANYPDAVRAVKSGADDYLPKPVDPERLLDTVRELLRPSLSLPQGGKTLFRLGSPAAREVERMATLVAPVEVSVLILGANGTGKESVARRIHEESDRRLMPFVAVNCSVISKELAPSLLFGHAKGSFTGAEKDTEGYFGMAEGGTLFLDEIGTLGYEAQSMLLRVLQEGTYTPVAATGNGGLTCASSPPPMRIWRKASARTVSGKTCTTVSPSSRYICLRCASAVQTSCRWRVSSGSVSPPSCASRRRVSRRRRRNVCCPTRGRGTSARCRTVCAVPCCWRKARWWVRRNWASPTAARPPLPAASTRTRRATRNGGPR